MPCSPQKIQSNRENAKKSSGPKTAEGKAKVARNATKHGLRSAEVVLPGEDASQFESMRKAWFDDWQPPTDARRVLVELAVAHAWRLRRCLRAERAHFADASEEARRERLRAGRRWAEGLVQWFGDRPREILAELLDDPDGDGVAWLLDAWRALLPAATADGWCDLDDHHRRLLNLNGLADDADPEDVGGVALASWRLVERNAPRLSFHHDAEAGDDTLNDAEARCLADELRALIVAKIDEFERRLAALALGDDPETKVAGELSAFEDTPRSRVLLRYEAQHAREFRSTLNQLVKLTQTDDDVVTRDAPAAVDDRAPAAEAPSRPAPDRPEEAGKQAANSDQPDSQVIHLESVAPDRRSAPNKPTGSADPGPARPGVGAAEAPRKGQGRRSNR